MFPDLGYISMFSEILSSKFAVIVKIQTCIWRYPVRTLMGTRTLTKNVHSFPQSLQENVGIAFQTRKQMLVPTFFLIHFSRHSIYFDAVCIFLEASLK